jgi:1-acyl-sn-glycerol-3-phosphate acyltransferase
MRRSFFVWCIRSLAGAHARWMHPRAYDGQCIYFANHTSNLDAAVLWASLPPELRDKTRPVAARDYWQASRLRRYLAEQVFRAVLIERKKVTVHTNPIPLMIEAMGDQYSLIIFPEGGRGQGEEVGEFKSGLFHLAKGKPEAALIPVFIENLNRILPKGEVLPVPLMSTITFGAPLKLEESESKAVFLERARRAVCELNPNGHEHKN